MSAEASMIHAISDEVAEGEGRVINTLLFIVAGIYSIFGHIILPGILQEAVAGIASIFLVLAACLPIVRHGVAYLDIRSFALVISICTILMTYTFLNSMDTPLSAYIPMIIRNLAGISALVYFTRYNGTILAGAKLTIYAIVAIVALGYTALHGAYDYAGILRPQPFSGEDAVHSSSYIVCAAFLGLVLMRVRREIGWFAFCLLGLPLLGLLLAYQVRTTWVMTLVFFAVLLFQAIRRGTTRRMFSAMLGMGLAACILMLLALTFFYLPNLDVTELSSGRTSTYAERFSMLAERSAGQLLFGGGLGSDMFYSSIWWWAAKDSHNDLLSITIEQGLVGLLMVFIILGVSLRHANSLQVAVLLSFVSGSLISNALLSRPMPAVLFLAIMLPTSRRFSKVKPRAARRRLSSSRAPHWQYGTSP